MTTDPSLPADPGPRRTGQGAMTAQLALRQFFLLFLAGTCLLFVAFFFRYYTERLSFWEFWQNQPWIELRFIRLPSILVAIYGFVLLNGVLFALGPSERSFNFFFASMMLALLALNYDHSLLDWFVFLVAKVRPPNPVSAFKILFGGLFLLVLIVMHYNVLSDDFARRMLRRGVPTEEVARIRPGMFKVLIPVVLTSIALAFGLALLGEVSALLFQQGSLLPKLQLLLLAALVIPIAYLVRGLLKDIAARRQPVQEKQGPIVK